MGNSASGNGDQKIGVQEQSIQVLSNQQDVNTMLLFILCALKVFEIIVFMYRLHTRRIINRHAANQANP